MALRPRPIILVVPLSGVPTMFIATKIWFDPDTFQPVVWDGYEYVGPLALLKKGREAQAENTKFQQQLAKDQAARQTAEQGQVDTNLKPYDQMGPADMTNAASAQLAADTDNINRVYNGMRQTAFASMGARGGGGSQPSGFGTAATNGVNLSQSQAETGAFRNAQINSEKQRNFATQVHSGMSGQNIQGTQGATTAATNSAYDQSKMGSTLGDVVGGVAQLGGAVMPFLPGGGIMNAFKSLGQRAVGGGAPSGVGTYANDRQTA